jgi:hypothetical protein
VTFAAPDGLPDGVVCPIATQNLADEQERPSSTKAVFDSVIGADHFPCLRMNALPPRSSAAMQNVVVGQDMSSDWPTVNCARLVRLDHLAVYGADSDDPVVCPPVGAGAAPPWSLDRPDDVAPQAVHMAMTTAVQPVRIRFRADTGGEELTRINSCDGAMKPLSYQGLADLNRTQHHGTCLHGH